MDREEWRYHKTRWYYDCLQDYQAEQPSAAGDYTVPSGDYRQRNHTLPSPDHKLPAPGHKLPDHMLPDRTLPGRRQADHHRKLAAADMHKLVEVQWGIAAADLAGTDADKAGRLWFGYSVVEEGVLVGG